MTVSEVQARLAIVVDGELGKNLISFVATDNTAASRLGGEHVMELVGAGDQLCEWVGRVGFC